MHEVHQFSYDRAMRKHAPYKECMRLKALFDLSGEKLTKLENRNLGMNGDAT